MPPVRGHRTPAPVRLPRGMSAALRQAAVGRSVPERPAWRKAPARGSPAPRRLRRRAAARLVRAGRAARLVRAGRAAVWPVQAGWSEVENLAGGPRAGVRCGRRQFLHAPRPEVRAGLPWAEVRTGGPGIEVRAGVPGADQVPAARLRPRSRPRPPPSPAGALERAMPRRTPVQSRRRCRRPRGWARWRAALRDRNRHPPQRRRRPRYRRRRSASSSLGAVLPRRVR